MTNERDDQREEEAPRGDGFVTIGARPKFGVRAARQIRDAIMVGEYLPGQKLLVNDVARQLGVSSMPVREALVVLASEGLLDVLPRRGFTVSRIQRRDIEDIILVHAFVAGALAERSAGVIAAPVIDQLREIQRSLEAVARAGDDASHRAEIGDLNFAFHRTINKQVKANRLMWFLRAVTSYVPRNVHEAIPEWSAVAVADHPAIIEALAAHDARAAREATERHVRHTGAKLMDHLERRGFWAEQPPA